MKNVDISRKSGPQGYPGAVRVDPRPTLGLFASYNKALRGLLSGNKLPHFKENRSHLEKSVHIYMNSYDILMKSWHILRKIYRKSGSILKKKINM